MNKENKSTEVDNTDKKLHISGVIDSEIKIVNSGIYGTFNNEFKQIKIT